MLSVSLLLIDPYQPRVRISLGTNSYSGRWSSRSILLGTERGPDDEGLLGSVPLFLCL